jgi:hypothetical protein
MAVCVGVSVAGRLLWIDTVMVPCLNGSSATGGPTAGYRSHPPSHQATACYRISQTQRSARFFQHLTATFNPLHISRRSPSVRRCADSLPRLTLIQLSEYPARACGRWRRFIHAGDFTVTLVDTINYHSVDLEKICQGELAVD